MPELKEKRVIIDKETLVPVGAVAVFVLATIWLNDKLTNIDYRLRAIEERVDDRFTRTEMRHFAEMLESRNPTLDVPELPGARIP